MNSCKECEIIQCYKRTGSILEQEVKNLGFDVQKLSAIFDEMQNQAKLKSFTLSSNEPMKSDLSSIPSNILATAFSKIEVLSLENLSLSSR